MAISVFMVACGGSSATPAVPDAPGAPDAPETVQCGPGLSACGSTCVDLQTSAEHCGSCARACASGALCAQGSCVVPPSDCRVDGPCPADHYCDIGDGTCKVGCAQDRDCGAHKSCNTASRTCQCVTGYHDCAGTCASNDALTTCGDRCAPCTPPAHADSLCESQSCSFTCQIGYDRNGSACISRSWKLGSDLPAERIDAATTTGNDGRIYVLAGTSQNLFAAPFVYTPGPTGRWDPMALPTWRTFAAAATGSDGRVYLVGGAVAGGSTGSQPTSAAEVYTPSTNSWASLPDMPTPRQNLRAAAGDDGRIYVMGGDQFPATTGALNTVEIYAPQTNIWTTAAPMPTARSGHAVLSVGGTLYAIGGDFEGTMDAYDPATNTWTRRAPLMTPRRLFAAAVGHDGRIYVMGGYRMGTGSEANPVGMTSAEAYTPASNSWTSVGDMPTGRFSLAAATGGDGRIYAIGGRVRFTMTGLATVEIFQP